MATVKLTKVGKVYEDASKGGVRAVEAVDLAIADGEFCVLVGPSGCGKSTTLRMIAGLEEISEGVLEIDGRPVNDLPAKDTIDDAILATAEAMPTATLRFFARLRSSKSSSLARCSSKLSSLIVNYVINIDNL